MGKKRVIVSYHKLTPELRQLVWTLYPDGFHRFLQRVGVGRTASSFYVFPLDTEETSYLVKVPLEDDEDPEDADTHWQDPEAPEDSIHY